MWGLLRNFPNCGFNKRLSKLRSNFENLRSRRCYFPFNVCLRHQANPRSSLLLRSTILNISSILFFFGNLFQDFIIPVYFRYDRRFLLSLFFPHFRRSKSLCSHAMSFSDSGSSSSGGDYKTFRQITRESELLLPILCFVFKKK